VGEANQGYVTAHLHDCSILNLDVSGLAAPERGNEASECSIVGCDRNVALRTAFAELAVVVRQNPRKQVNAAAVDPDGQLRTRVSDLMRVYSQAAFAALIESEIHVSPRRVACHDMGGRLRLSEGRSQEGSAADKSCENDSPNHDA
jgi:hypothetical protein